MTRSVRQLQPTIGRLGGYNIAQLTAPRVPVPQTNNLLELAKGLKVTSDIVVTYDQIKQTQNRQQEALDKARALKGKERQQYEQAVMTEGATQFDLDPGGVSRQMEAYEREVRKLAEEGKMPEQSNALFMLGAKQAKGKVLANSVYREMLFNPQTISETIDPIQTVQEKRQELFSRPEFQSELVKEAALENIEKIEQAFIKDVNDRFDAVDIEDGKNNWLLNGKPLMNQAINGQLDINDPSIKNWINDKAGLFKGSRKFAWDNLIKEDLKEGLTTGEYTPTAVLDFVEDLRELNLGGGIKFADAETGNAISDFVGHVEDRRATLENKAKEAINIQFEEVKFDATNVFYKEVQETGSVSQDTLMAQIDRAIELVPLHKRDQLIADIQGSWSNATKLRDEATKVVFDDFVRDIEEGLDLDTVKENLNKSVDSGSITPSDYDKLNTRLENSRDFHIQIIKSPSYIDLKHSYEEVITGFRKSKSVIEGLIDKSSAVSNYFTTIDRNKNILKTEEAFDGPKSIYEVIKQKKGEAKAKMFVNRQYRTFDRLLTNKLELEFNKQIGLGRTIEQAKTYIDENQDTIAEKQFQSWVDASITLAETTYLK